MRQRVVDRAPAGELSVEIVMDFTRDPAASVYLAERTALQRALAVLKERIAALPEAG